MKHQPQRDMLVSESAELPQRGCFAVIFTSRRTEIDPEGYASMSERMVELAAQQPGFLGIESTRDANGIGITVSYWESLDAIRHWRENSEHRLAQRLGKEKWYEWFNRRIARVERDYTFQKSG